LAGHLVENALWVQSKCFKFAPWINIKLDAIVLDFPALDLDTNRFLW